MLNLPILEFFKRILHRQSSHKNGVRSSDSSSTNSVELSDLSSSASSDSSPIPSTPKESSKEIRRSGRFKRNSIRISTRHEGYKSDGATEEFSSTVGILDLSSITSNDKLVQPSPRKASHGLSPRLKDDSPSSPRRSVSPRKGPSSPRNQIDPDHLSPKSPRLPKLSTTSNDEEKPGCSILFLPRDNRSPSPTADSSGGGSSLIEKDVPKDKDSSPRNSDLVERQSPSSIPSPTSNEVSELQLVIQIVNRIHQRNELLSIQN